MTTYNDFMTPERADSILNAPHTIEGLHYVLEVLSSTAYIVDRPPQFYTDIYAMIGIAHVICDELIKNDTM